MVPDEPRLSVDRDSGLPIYLQIKYQVINDISMGRLIAGQVPSIRQAARQLGVTPTTVRHAYDSLADDGFVVGLPGKGVVVTELAPTPQAEAIRRQDTLSDLLRPTVIQALGLGYAPSEIQAAVTRSLTEGDRAPTILFVGAEPEFIEYYTPLVADAVRDLHVAVEAMPLSRLENKGCGSVPFPSASSPRCAAFRPCASCWRRARRGRGAGARSVDRDDRQPHPDSPRRACGALSASESILPGFSPCPPVRATDEPITEVVPEHLLHRKQLTTGRRCHPQPARAGDRGALAAPPIAAASSSTSSPIPTVLAQVRQAIQQRLGWRIFSNGYRREVAMVPAGRRVSQAGRRRDRWTRARKSDGGSG